MPRLYNPVCAWPGCGKALDEANMKPDSMPTCGAHKAQLQLLTRTYNILAGFVTTYLTAVINYIKTGKQTADKAGIKAALSVIVSQIEQVLKLEQQKEAAQLQEQEQALWQQVSAVGGQPSSSSSPAPAVNDDADKLAHAASIVQVKNAPDAATLRMAAQAIKDGTKLPDHQMQLTAVTMSLLTDEERKLFDAAKLPPQLALPAAPKAGEDAHGSGSSSEDTNTGTGSEDDAAKGCKRRAPTDDEDVDGADQGSMSRHYIIGGVKYVYTDKDKDFSDDIHSNKSSYVCRLATNKAYTDLPEVGNKANMEQAMNKAGVLYVKPTFLTADGIRRVAGQYREACRDGKLVFSTMPGIDDGDEAWQQWVRKLPCTCAWVPLFKADIRSDAWDIVVGVVLAYYQETCFQ